jgi:hypothetical protein
MGQNIPILVLFPLLVLAESYWIISNKSVRRSPIIYHTIIIGGLFGLMWASFIVYTGKDFTVYRHVGNGRVQPSSKGYRCKPSSRQHPRIGINLGVRRYSLKYFMFSMIHVLMYFDICCL